MRRFVRSLIAAMSLIPPAATAEAADPERRGERELMVLTIENLAATAGIRGHDRIARPVLDAMRKVPRHLLVPEDVRARAYQDRALPIGHDVTISQPFIVALMTDLLDVSPGQRVLEVGTGSGYQAAVLATLGAEVHSIEIIAPVGERAARDLAALGYKDVRVTIGDGYAGLPGRAPFDRIIVTAGAPEIPQPLIDQLRPGGRMVIPVRAKHDGEDLIVLRKHKDGRISRDSVLPVRFVPLTRAP